MGTAIFFITDFFKRNPKTLLYIIIGIVLVAFVGTIAYILHENSVLTKENSELTAANKVMKDAIEKSIKSNNINSQTHVAISESEKEVDNKKNEIQDNLTKKENEIRNKYQNQSKTKESNTNTNSNTVPNTPSVATDNNQAMDDEIATARIDSLNELYCTYSSAEKNKCSKE